MVLRLLLLVSGLLLLTPGAGVAAEPQPDHQGDHRRDFQGDDRGVWPLRPPVVVAGFDPPTDPWGSGHRGVDLRGRVGQPVHAALPGRVSFVGRIAGRGVVVVDHGDTRTTYEPVGDAPPVGSVVPAGGRIGRLEPVGSHCAPDACLHWGWIRGDTYLDPLLLVGGGPIRLLPLTGLPAADGPIPRVPVPEPLSGAGVGLLVGLPQTLGGDMRVELGRRE